MSSELKIFHSLNCYFCKAPYSRSSNDAKYPYELLCGKAICRECWRKEGALKKEERKHQCDFQWNCYDLYKDPSFFRDLLNDSSIIESPNGSGWLLSEPITNPLKCSKCDVKCSMKKDESKPVILDCGHKICTKCYLTTRTAHSIPVLAFWLKCSICNDSSSYSESIEMKDNWLREFLRELPEMIEQIPKVNEIRIETLSISEKRQIGSGAFGEVFEVIGHKPPAVIKYINCISKTQVLHFQQEIDVLRKLKHPNIVTLLIKEWIKESTKFGIVMEYCERGTLRDALSNPNIIYTMKVVICWGELLFDALSYVFQEHKVIHRDIKPENIFLTKDFMVKIGDFGFVKYSEQSCSGSFLGTERYMSPPQLADNHETIQGSHWNDVYSLGLVLWEIIERRIVFSEYNQHDRFYRDLFISDINHNKIDKLAAPSCQPELQEIVAQCVDFNRLSRPVASIVFEKLRQLGKNQTLRAMQNIPIEDESQNKIVRPLGFDETMRWIPIRFR